MKLGYKLSRLNNKSLNCYIYLFGYEGGKRGLPKFMTIYVNICP